MYQQTQRWLAAGCFKELIDDLRAVLRLETGRKAEPSAAIIDSRTLRSTPESGERAATAAIRHGIALEVVNCLRPSVASSPCRNAESSNGHSPGQPATGRLVKDYERYAETLAGLHVVAFACLMMKQPQPSLQVRNSLQGQADEETGVTSERTGWLASTRHPRALRGIFVS